MNFVSDMLLVINILLQLALLLLAPYLLCDFLLGKERAEYIAEKLYWNMKGKTLNLIAIILIIAITIVFMIRLFSGFTRFG